MLERAESIAALRANFQWAIPDRFNIGVDICDKHAALTPNAPAIVDVAADMSHVTYSFADLRDLSNQCARQRRKGGCDKCRRNGKNRCNPR